MTNQVGSCMVLSDPQGTITDAPARAIGVALKAALTGSLSIFGLVDAAGASVGTFTMNASANGLQSVPGNAATGGKLLSYTLSNPASDSGKATVFWTN